MKDMRLAAGLFCIIAILAMWSLDAKAFSRSDIHLSSGIIPQGDLSRISIRVKDGEIPRVSWMDREISLIASHEKNVWEGFLTADLMEKPGRYKALVEVSPSGDNEILKIEVVDKDYGVRRLTLPKEMVDLDQETLKRVKSESAIMNRLWEAPVSPPEWSGPFLMPVQGDIIGPFGRRSIINNQPRSPHSGVDLRGERGTPVRAVNNGKVVLTAYHFFAGRSLVLDHGGGIMSMYFHLEKILVKEGDMVLKGDVIGLVGSTGRATGPHLHWGMRVNGARINPLRLIEISQELEK
jgi:murein DD-endopeptidase MepM/ murein hydrolase activator NlpD